MTLGLNSYCLGKETEYCQHPEHPTSIPWVLSRSHSPTHRRWPPSSKTLLTVRFPFFPHWEKVTKKRKRFCLVWVNHWVMVLVWLSSFLLPLTWIFCAHWNNRLLICRGVSLLPIKLSIQERQTAPESRVAIQSRAPWGRQEKNSPQHVPTLCLCEVAASQWAENTYHLGCSPTAWLAHCLLRAEENSSALTFWASTISNPGWEVGGRFEREETYVYLWLIHVDLWQKQ